jgi:hypothetical protein
MLVAWCVLLAIALPAPPATSNIVADVSHTLNSHVNNSFLGSEANIH